MKKELEEIRDWELLRQKVKDSYGFDTNWDKSIELFKNRLNRKFFDPVKYLIETRKFEGEGFSIVTVQCALIESLASFRTGQIFNYGANGNSPSYEYRDSKRMFVDFLLSASIFKDNFYEIDENGVKKNNTPFNAENFYSDVRCGLMHEARTKGKWIINAKKHDDKSSPKFLEKREDKFSILRTILHYKLKQYVANYCDELRLKDSQELRRLFGRKLDFLFETFENKDKFEWWLDK